MPHPKKMKTDKFQRVSFIADKVTFPAFALDHDNNSLVKKSPVTMDWHHPDFSVTLGGHTVTLLEHDFDNFIVQFDRYCRSGSHRQWIDDPEWKKLYQVKRRRLQRVTGTSTAVRAPLVSSVPCHHCGLVLPTATVIQLDHTHPRNAAIGSVAGQSRAVAKVLRALWPMTVQSRATGAKAAALGKPKPIPPSKPNFNYAYGKMKKPKYTLTTEGEILLGFLVVRERGQQRRVLTKCVNSFINITPLCAACNGPSKGASIRRV